MSTLTDDWRTGRLDGGSNAMNQPASPDKKRSATTDIGIDGTPLGRTPDANEPDTIDDITEPGRQQLLRLPPARIDVGSLLGSYRIDKYLDRGGMAAVYEALDLRLHRRVALKVLDSELARGTEFRRRFLRESTYAASLEHPNIVPIYEASEDRGFLYIAMRCVRGGNLEGLIARRGLLEPRHALAILTPIADALDAAHKAGLIHRDVKPANILLDDRRGRAAEHVYLSDFGVTKQLSGLSKLTATGSFIGTLEYTAPEQIRGEAVDARSDLYSLACVAYRCLTGELPFTRSSQAALLWAHQQVAPQSLSQHRPELRRADPVIRKALSKDSTDRYNSCGEFMTALTDALLVGDTRVPPSDGWAIDQPSPTRRPAAAKTTPSRRGGLRSALVVLTAGVALATAIVGSSPVLRDSSPLSALSAISPNALTNELQDQDGDRIETVIPPSRSGSSTTAPPTGDENGSTSSGVAAPAPSAQPEPAQAIPTIDGPPIDVGETLDDVAMTPDGRFAYVASSGSGLVAVLDLRTGRSVAQISVAVGPPRFVAVSPDGGQVFVSVYNNQETTNVIVVIDAITNSIVDTITVDRAPHAAAFSPDGRFAYVPSAGGHVVDIIGVGAAEVVRKVNVPPGPHSIAVAPDGKLAYIANYESDVVTILDTTTNAVIDTVSVGAGPRSIAVSTDGKHVAVICQESNEVYFLDAASSQVVGTAPVGANPTDLAFSPDSGYVYAASLDTQKVFVIHTVSHTTTAEVPVSSPSSISVQNSGRRAYVTNSVAGTLTVLKTA